MQDKLCNSQSGKMKSTVDGKAYNRSMKERRENTICSSDVATVRDNNVARSTVVKFTIRDRNEATTSDIARLENVFE